MKLLAGIIFLILGFPVGNLLREKTKDEQKQGRIWFKILTAIGMLGGIVGLVIGKDWILFTFFFIAIVTSRSLIHEDRKKNKKKN